MQARFAPVMRMLAHMESNEQVEITDRYKRTTGDPETDAVLASIRTEEQGHSRSLDAIQATHGGGEPPTSGAEGKLNRILGRETWHRTGSGWISGAIYGASGGAVMLAHLLGLWVVFVVFTLVFAGDDPAHGAPLDGPVISQDALSNHCYAALPNGHVAVADHHHAAGLMKDRPRLKSIGVSPRIPGVEQS